MTGEITASLSLCLLHIRANIVCSVRMCLDYYTYIYTYMIVLSVCAVLCRIMVLRDGQIVEFDAPNQLLAMKGVFYDMAKDAGLA